MAKEVEQPKSETTTVVMSRDLASMVRAIADRRDVTMAEVLEQFARPGIVKEYRKVLTEMHEVLGGGG